MARWLIPLIAFLLPLAVWPSLEQPFSSPKLVLIGCWILLATGWILARRRTPRIELTSAQAGAYLAWLAVIGLSALTGELVSLKAMLLLLLPVLCFPLLLWVRMEPARLCLAFAFSSLVVSSTAVLQYLGWDPFRLIGWMPQSGGSERLLVCGTLGNPNFVAAFLAGCLPLLVALLAGEEGSEGRLRWQWLLAILLNVAAILATGSRAPALAFIATVPVLLVGSRHTKLRSQPGRKAARLASIGSSFAWKVTIVGTIAVALAVGIVALSPARPLPTTLGGRAYIGRIVLRNIAEIPLFGFGPGAFSVKYLQWETSYLREEPRMAEGPFRGPQDHVHNDYLELLTDTGPVGLVSFLTLLLLLAWPVIRGTPDRFALAGLAGAAIMLTIALVDFPLYRPAESFLLWRLLALASAKRGAK